MRNSRARVAATLLTIVGALAPIASVGAQSRPAAAAVPATAKAGVPVADDYVIGPEDVLSVLFWRDPDMSGDVTVRPDGKITLPLIGEITAVGLKPEALRDDVRKAAERFLADANVNVVVRQVNSRKVFITGQVGQPGAFALTAPRTVLQLIALAGGLSEYAKGDNITIMRAEQGRTRIFKFNYKNVSKGKALQQNIQLMPGDTVVVP